jgi:hypothetical protein
VWITFVVQAPWNSKGTAQDVSVLSRSFPRVSQGTSPVGP